MVEVLVYVLILGLIITVVGVMLPALSFSVGGWSSAVAIINYGFLFIDPAVFTVCFLVIITMSQADLLWSLGHWLIKVVKF